MEKGDKALLVSTILFGVLIFIGVGQSLAGFVVADNATVQNSVGVGEYIFGSIMPRFFDILKSPFTTPEMLWVAMPLLVVILFMQLYFGRWRNEKLGWSSAFANWITLLFVAVNLFKEMMAKYSLLASAPPSIIYILPAIPLGQKFIPVSVLYKFMMIFLLLFLAVLFMIILFAHAIPKKASFMISSPLTIYTFAFIMIALVYSSIPLDLATILAALLVYILILIIFRTVKTLVPPSEEAKRYLIEKEKIRRKEIGIAKAIKTRKRHDRERNFKKFFGRFRIRAE